MTDINNENGKDPKKTETAAPKKKLNVVFRSQNSTSIKELPKGLKSAAEGGQKRVRPLPIQKEAVKETTVEAAKKPRPLPAGTKPVRPAVFGVEEDQELKASAVVEKGSEDKKETTKKDTVKKTVKAVENKEEAGETSAEKKTTRKTASNITEDDKTAQETKAVEKTQAKDEKTVKPVETVQAAEEAPRIKVVKSYANYDASKIIKEAQAASKAMKANNEGRDFGKSSADRNRNPRPQGARNDSRGEGRGEKAGGRTFVARGNAAPGGRDGQGRLSTGGKPGASQAPARDFGGGSQKPSAGKNKNAYSAKDKREKKDKYRDDFEVQKNVKTGKGAFIKPEPKKEKPEDEIKVIVISESLTIKDLSDKLKIQPSVIVKKLFLSGKMVTPNTELSYEEAEEIAMEYDILCEKEVQEDVIAELLREDEEDASRLVPRSPVVCVMGHVDHGKTSLLDAIRNTSVTSHEAGGITQHIGASVVKVGDRNITFLDTPGHEAFTAMRLRGAQSTDIAVLVVAADDGVKPQTIEAINHAKSAGVTIVVAINKMDKPTANIDMVKNALSEYELISEDWGGSTTMVPVSAKTGEGIKDLLEMILLEADVLELKADPNRNARGLVIEAELDKGRGPVATMLVQKGTLNIGDNVAAGSCYGKVRAMLDDKGNRIKKAGPATPVEILGLNDVPNAGEVFMVCHDEKEARSIAETFIAEHKKHMLEDTKQKMNLDDLYNEIQAGNIKELPIIVKADVQGSVEAVKQSLGKLSNEEVAVKVVHAAVGNINESDVSLASAANAVIIGFNVKPDPTAKSVAEQEKVDIRLYRVIYQAIEDLQAALTGMLAPVYEEKDTGRAIVRQIFKASGVGIIAGCYVTDGMIERGSKARIFRNDKKIFDGDILSLKRFKDEVKEVKTGFECGMVFDGFSEIEVDDNIEIYKMVQVPRDQVKKEQ